MPNYFLSKKDHQHDQAKKMLEQIGLDLIGGTPIDLAKHAEIAALHAEADVMDHEFLCAFGHTFPAEAVPENTHIRIFANTIILPGGEVIRPDIINGVVMELPLAICAEHGAAQIAQAATHDWTEADVKAKPIKKEDKKP